MKKKILCFFGTRPEAIKMAPVIEKIKRQTKHQAITVVSAQHRDMLDQVCRLFSIKPHTDLNLMKRDQSLFDITESVLNKMNRVLDKIKPDLVLVHGDTTTTLAGALSAYYKKIPVGHVEAGLRTKNLYEPFPEEANRRLTDSLCALHFAPTKTAKDNLTRENFSLPSIFVTGNTVIDALFEAKKKSRKYASKKCERVIRSIASQKKKFILITAHRRENFGKPFLNICGAVLNLSQAFPDIHWVYPVHPNPNVRRPVFKKLSKRKNIHLLEPIGYGDMVNLINQCLLVVTDSGGLQEEAPSFGKPVLVLRTVTERPEAVMAGTVRLVGTDKKKIINNVKQLINNSSAYQKMARAVNPYGDGKASDRIIQAIEWFFNPKRKRPLPFRSTK